MRIVIQGGKDAFGTRVFDAETGHQLEVRKVTWTHKAGELPVATVEVVADYFEAEAEATVVKAGP